MPGAPRRVAVLGAGAVGTLLGGLLAASGADVVLLDPRVSPERRRARSSSTSPTVAAMASPACAAPLPRPTLPAPPDLAVLAVKTFDLAGALDDLRAWPATPVLTIQNGVGAEDLVGRRASRRRARRRLADGPGGAARARTRWAGAAAAASAWRPWPARRTSSSTGSSGCSRGAGLPARRLADARAMKWSKLARQPRRERALGAGRPRPGRDLRRPALFDLERRQLLEALAVMRAQGIRVVALPGANVPLLALGVRLPAPLSRARSCDASSAGPGAASRRRCGSTSGAGRRGPSEVAWLNGPSPAPAPPLGVPTPVNGALAALVDAATVDPDLAAGRRCDPGRSPGPRRLASRRSGPTRGTTVADRRTDAVTREDATVQTLEIEIRNPNGLHLRPLGQFVRTCGRTRSEVTIQNLSTGAGPANAKQMLRVQPLGVRQGHLVRITAEGDDEVEAIAAIRAAIEAGLGEEVRRGAPPAPAGGATPAAAPDRSPAPSGARRPLPPASAPVRRGLPPAPAQARGGRLGARRIIGEGAVAGIAIAPAWRYREHGRRCAAAAARRRGGGDPRGRRGRPRLSSSRSPRGSATPAGPTTPGSSRPRPFSPRIPRSSRRPSSGSPAGHDPAAAVADAAAEAAAMPSPASTTSCSRPARPTCATSAPGSRGSSAARRWPCPSGPSSRSPTTCRRRSPPRSRPRFLLGIALAGGSRTAHAVILARGLGIPCVVGCAGLLEALADAAGRGTGAGARSPSTARPARSSSSPSRGGARAARAARRGPRRPRRARAAAGPRPARARPPTAPACRLVANIGSPDDAAARDRGRRRGRRPLPDRVPLHAAAGTADRGRAGRRLPTDVRGLRPGAPGRRPPRRHRRGQGHPVPPAARRRRTPSSACARSASPTATRSSCGRSCGRSGGRRPSPASSPT